MDPYAMSVHHLRRRWKPFKERVRGNRRYEPVCIRFHRACSWLQRTEELGQDEVDQRLILQWIAFNSLYGRWDPSRREPQQDKPTIREFLARILDLDEEGRVQAVLAERRQAVLAVFGDEFLSAHFWEDPGRSGGSGGDRRKAAGWYAEGRFGMILEKLIERIYLLRCQLIHGAATCGGRLNRKALRLCSRLLGDLLSAFLLTIIDHGTEEDWGPLCYPPVGGGQVYL